MEMLQVPFFGTTYFVYSGFSNIVSHPNSIEDLSVTTGLSTGTLSLTWTAPTASSFCACRSRPTNPSFFH